MPPSSTGTFGTGVVVDPTIDDVAVVGLGGRGGGCRYIGCATGGEGHGRFSVHKPAEVVEIGGDSGRGQDASRTRKAGRVR